MEGASSATPFDFLPHRHRDRFRIEVASVDKHADDVDRIIRQIFVPEMETVRALPHLFTDYATEYNANAAARVLSEYANHSLVVVDEENGDEVIGLRISGCSLKPKGEPDYYEVVGHQISDKFKSGNNWYSSNEEIRQYDVNLYHCFTMVSQMEEEADLFARFPHIDKLSDLCYLAVDGRHRGTGIGAKLLELNLRMATALGYELGVGCFLGDGVQRIAARNGFQVASERCMSQYRDSSGVAVFAGETADVKFKLMFKLLSGS